MSKLSLLALAAGLLLPIAACADTAAVNNGNSGYFPTADAPLVAPNAYNTGSSGSTISRQQESGYFPTADASLVPADTHPGDASQTLERQRESGYFPTADAPLVAPSANYR